MQPPAFWFRDRHAPGLLPHLLAPLARLWTVMTRRRLAKGPYERLAVPVICVGNLSLGGAGKTPTVMALITELTSRGWPRT